MLASKFLIPCAQVRWGEGIEARSNSSQMERPSLNHTIKWINIKHDEKHTREYKNQFPYWPFLTVGFGINLRSSLIKPRLTPTVHWKHWHRSQRPNGAPWQWQIFWDPKASLLTITGRDSPSDLLVRFSSLFLCNEIQNLNIFDHDRIHIIWFYDCRM